MILIYSKNKSNRLNYILEILFTELIGIEFKLTTNRIEFIEYTECKLAYNSKPISNELFLASKELLFKTKIENQNLQFINHLSIESPFATFNKHSLFPFDL